MKIMWDHEVDDLYIPCREVTVTAKHLEPAVVFALRLDDSAIVESEEIASALSSTTARLTR